MDRFFSFVTQYKNFLPVLVPGLVLLLWKGGPKGRWFVLALGLAVLAADQSASHLVKPWVERVRPCNALEGVLTPAGKSSSLSFPSSHASNMGALLVVIALTYGKWAWWFLPLGLASGLSRVYLGLHYPFDVLGGFLLGGLLGWAVWRGIEKLKKLRAEPQRHPAMRAKRAKAAGSYRPLYWLHGGAAHQGHKERRKTGIRSPKRLHSAFFVSLVSWWFNGI